MLLASIVLPTGIIDYPLTILSIAGGLWTDNSQIFAPEVDATNDYHGIASDGSQMKFEEGIEILLFTFELPETSDSKKVRLFDNRKDPKSNQVGMNGSDFCNFYACALRLIDVYAGVYSTEDRLNEATETLTTSSQSELMIGLELYQNEPNPFKEYTTIAYTLPGSSQVTLTIRDETGKILQVIQEDQKKGKHFSVFWKENFQKDCCFTN